MPNWSPSCAVSVFLFLLLLTPVSPNCRKGTADECRLALNVPGSSYAGSGINIHTLEHTSPVYEEKQKIGECTVCENSLLKGRPFQRLPKFVTLWNAKDHLCQEAYSVHHSPISVAEALTALHVRNDWRKELDVEISPTNKVQWALAGSESKFTEECVKKSSKANYTYLLHHKSCSFYEFEVEKSHSHSGHFNTEIHLLPEKYNRSTKDDYFRLIRDYGTHWMKDFVLGARIITLAYFPVCKAVLEDITISELGYCVSVEAQRYFGFNTAEDYRGLEDCEKKMKYDHLFNRITESETGWFYSSGGWLEAAKYSPGLLSFSLEPLHTLVDEANPRRESLRQALSDYVRKYALWRNCSKPCPPGSQPSATEFCSCGCPSNDFTNSMCCSRRRGVAKLSVTILRGANLWGDLFSRSDAYVSVSIKNRKMCTRTVWNNNNPTWNVTLDFGVMELDKDFNKLIVQVWDEDSGWDDDLLGECIQALQKWQYVTQSCVLSQGFVNYKLHLKCGHNLIGPSCQEFSIAWPHSQFHPDSYNHEGNRYSFHQD